MLQKKPDFRVFVTRVDSKNYVHGMRVLSLLLGIEHAFDRKIASVVNLQLTAYFIRHDACKLSSKSIDCFRSYW